jgi:hypothetical protein
MVDPIKINRRAWDERAGIHARDATGSYRLDRFRAGDPRGAESEKSGERSARR